MRDVTRTLLKDAQRLGLQRFTYTVYISYFTIGKSSVIVACVICAVLHCLHLNQQSFFSAQVRSYFTYLILLVLLLWRVLNFGYHRWFYLAFLFSMSSSPFSSVPYSVAIAVKTPRFLACCFLLGYHQPAEDFSLASSCQESKVAR